MLKLGFLMIMAGGWALAGAAIYVVRSPGGVTVVTKEHLTFTDTYSDTREWEKRDLSRHPEMIARLVATRNESALSHVIEGRKSRSSDDTDKIEQSAMSKVWRKSRSDSDDDERESSKSQRHSKVTARDLIDLAMGN